MKELIKLAKPKEEHSKSQNALMFQQMIAIPYKAQ